MEKISSIAKKHKLFVLEDCAQATGAKRNGMVAGSMSDLAAFSFYPTKVLWTYGDGGMVLTNSKKIEAKIRMLRMYGNSKEYYSEFLGYNSRLDEVHASILRFKLKNLKKYIVKRKKIAEIYYKKLKNTSLILPVQDPKGDHVFYVFVCRHPQRDMILESLKTKGITLNVSYRYPVHLMKGFSFLGYKKGDFPKAERMANEIFSLPMYPELSKEDQAAVIFELKKII